MMKPMYLWMLLMNLSQGQVFTCRQIFEPQADWANAGANTSQRWHSRPPPPATEKARRKRRKVCRKVMCKMSKWKDSKMWPKRSSEKGCLSKRKVEDDHLLFLVGWAENLRHTLGGSDVEELHQWVALTASVGFRI